MCLHCMNKFLLYAQGLKYSLYFTAYKKVHLYGQWQFQPFCCACWCLGTPLSGWVAASVYRRMALQLAKQLSMFISIACLAVLETLRGTMRSMSRSPRSLRSTKRESWWDGIQFGLKRRWLLCQTVTVWNSLTPSTTTGHGHQNLS